MVHLLHRLYGVDAPVNTHAEYFKIDFNHWSATDCRGYFLLACLV